MIVFPNTPLTPTSFKVSDGSQLSHLSPNTLALRASTSNVAPSNHAELNQYTLKLENYLQNIFEDLVLHSSTDTLSEIINSASRAQISSTIPWKNVVYGQSFKGVRLEKPSIQWCISTEIAAAILAISEIYMKLSADIVSELMEEIPTENGSSLTTELDQKWKSAAEHYKSALSLISFGIKVQGIVSVSENSPLIFSPSIFFLFEKICNIGIQMSILCKSAWKNRASFTSDENFLSSNNGVLCRVAIWVFNEVLACQNIIRELIKSENNVYFLNLNYDKWLEYLAIFHRYVTAYSGLFLSIEYYQKSKLGQAIGLVNFSLLTLQSKNLGDVKKRGFERLINKIRGRKNESFLENLESVTSLNIDKSVFSDSSGAMINDLALLFDQLVLLHLKFSRENDNLRFETVTDWKDTRADSKWPLGAQIPVSAPKEFIPNAMKSSAVQEINVKQRGSYF